MEAMFNVQIVQGSIIQKDGEMDGDVAHKIRLVEVEKTFWISM